MAASNITVNQGTQTPIATDSVGGTQFGIVKLDMGTAGVSSPFAGTLPQVTNLANGTLSQIDNIGTLPNLPGGTITLSNPTGTTVTVDHGTVTLSNPTGTTVTVDHGTVTLSNPTGTTVTVDHGTITLSNPTGTTVQFNNGTIDLIKAGTITTLPNIPGGTITNLASGTINSATAVINSATISVLPNLPQGSINVTAGTITTGSIVVTAGTFVGNGGSIISYGAAAAAAAAVGNPVNIGGTDSGGTIRTIKVDSGGLQRIGLDSGTISVLPNLPQGSINITAGTIATMGTMGTLGLVNTVTTVSNLSAGSVNVIAGTIATLGTMGTLGLVNTITTVSNITNGSIVQTVGTVNTGTINAGTINLGTIVGKDANAALQSGNPIPMGGTDSGGTIRTILVNAGGIQSVQGGAANGSANAGNPFRIAATDGATTYDVNSMNTGFDNVASNVGITMGGFDYTFNGASWDRMRGNQDGTFLASGTYNTTQTQADQTNYNWRGIRMTMDITGTAATGTLTPEIDGKDVASGKYYAILTGGAVPAQVVSTNTYEVYPAIGTSASKASDILPRTFRLKVSETGSGTITYSVGYSLIK